MVGRARAAPVVLSSCVPGEDAVWFVLPLPSTRQERVMRPIIFAIAMVLVLGDAAIAASPAEPAVPDTSGAGDEVGSAPVSRAVVEEMLRLGWVGHRDVVYD